MFKALGLGFLAVEEKQAHVCICLCIYVCVCVYIYIYLSQSNTLRADTLAETLHPKP